MVAEHKYGKLMVLQELGLRKCGRQSYNYLKVHCDCGTEFELPATRVYTGHVQSCGCAKKETGLMLARERDAKYNGQKLEPGQRFGKLVVIEDLGFQRYDKHLRKMSVVKLNCDCGVVTIKPRGSVVEGKTRSCGCARVEHSRTMGLCRRKPIYEASLNYLLYTYKKRAAKKGYCFELDLELFRSLTSSNCYFCGAAPAQYEKSRNFNGLYVYNGLDRLDSKKGYTHENSVACCIVCNRAKSNMPLAEFLVWLQRIRRPQGDVSIDRIVDGFGEEISFEAARQYGWLLPTEHQAVHEEDTRNLFLDSGRQLLAYAFGFRSPIQNYTVQKFGVGTGITAAKVTDVALEAPITLSSGASTKAIDTVDFLSAFVVRIGFTLGLNDANGYLISEMGLYSGNDTLMTRKVRSVAIQKTSDFSPALTWRLRFVIPFLVTCASISGWS